MGRCRAASVRRAAPGRDRGAHRGPPVQGLFIVWGGAGFADGLTGLNFTILAGHELEKWLTSRTRAGPDRGNL
jgi:hypothetical protein